VDIQQLIQRSKNSFEDDPKKLTCANKNSPLVVVEASSKLKLEPLWQYPIDEREGPIYKQYVQGNPSYHSMYLREEVARRLYAALQHLPEHWKAILRDGHRPVAVQLKLLQSLVDKYKEDNPAAKNEEAIAYARTFVSDPAIKLPPHCCGEAVDVDVLDTNNGMLVDFGSAVNTPEEISFLHSDKVSEDQHDNRITLLSAMLKEGFAPCYDEWWHFTYGDRVWAYFYNQPQILYGIIEPEVF
jgi:zinc D-Ala-D-Ala dipeptidase